MARALNVQSKTYDEAKLAAMAAPFNVRIEKINGNTKMPIPLPESEEGVPAGTGWGVEEIRELEQWLVTEWAGGGLYEISVTDSSPQPQTMKWQPFWDKKLYPEKTPPPLVNAASAVAPPPPMIAFPPQPQQPQVSYNMTAFPRGLPQGQGQYSPYPQQQQPYVQQGYYQPPPMPNAPMPGTFQWDSYQREVERREQLNKDKERDNELRIAREAKERMERDALAARHAAELERERLANEARIQGQANQISELRNMIQGLASAIKEGASSSKASPEIEAMREQQRQTEARLEREQAAREAERRDNTLKESIRVAQEATQRQIEMMQRAMDDRVRAMETAAHASKQPDQLLMMFQNSQRESNELAKELSRSQVTQMQALQAYMMNPRDVMAMAKESSASVDSATDRVTRFFGQVIDTQQKVTENLLQMQPGSNGIVDLVGNGMDKIGSLAERYLGGKQLETQLAHQGQVQIAEAQARAYAESMRAQQPQPVARDAQPTPTPVAPTNGLGNIPPFVEPQPQQQQTKKPRAANAATAKADETKRLGKTDSEWFGPLLTNVQDLRVNAHKFIESLAKNPPRLDKQGNPVGMNPEQAAQAIIMAVQQVVQHQVVVPVMMELLFQDRYADFIDVLLPDPVVTQPYRDDVVQTVVRAANVASGRAPESVVVDSSQGQLQEPDDDDNDDDDDDADDDTIEADDAVDTTEDEATAHEELLEDHDEPEGDKANDGRAIPIAAKPNGTPLTIVPNKPGAKPVPTRRT